jgi:hypothetical protein
MPFVLGKLANKLAKKTFAGQVEEQLCQIRDLKPGKQIEIPDELTGRIILIEKNRIILIEKNVIKK